MSLLSIRLKLSARHWRACRPSCERGDGSPRRLRWINADGFRVCRFCWAVEEVGPVGSVRPEKLGRASGAKKLGPVSELENLSPMTGDQK
jgi:hypothetical protein